MEPQKRPGHLTAYARHAGISKQAAAKQLHRVGIDYSQPFEFAEADKRREAARHVDRDPHRTTVYVQPGESLDDDGDPPNGYTTVSAVFAEHQARREKFKAKLAELEYLERIGTLVTRAKVEEERFKTGRLVRDAMQNIPSRVAGILAAETDQRKVHDLLDREIRQALEALGDEQPTQPSGDVAA